MQNCPRCQMLIEDHETVCSVCAADDTKTSRYVEPISVPGVSPVAVRDAGTAAAGATALLERPASAVPMPTTVTYRGAGSGSGRRRPAVALIVVALVVVGVGVVTTRGDGPLAEALMRAGVMDTPPVTFPDSWTVIASSGGEFSVELPSSAKALDLGVDPTQAASSSTHGYEASLGEGGSTLVISSDMGMGGGAAALDDPAAFASLVDSMVAGLAGELADGRETVRREAPLGNGRAVDVVVVDEKTDTTIRARYQLAGGRIYAVVTRGVDAGGEALDAVHARVLDTMTPTH